MSHFKIRGRQRQVVKNLMAAIEYAQRQDARPVPAGRSSSTKILILDPAIQGIQDAANLLVNRCQALLTNL